MQMTENKTSENQTEQVGPTLNIQDLQNLLMILDYGSNQGIFRGWETTMAVYNLRQKLYDFLKHVDPNFDLPKQDQQNNQQQNSNAGNESANISAETKKSKKK